MAAIDLSVTATLHGTGLADLTIPSPDRSYYLEGSALNQIQAQHRPNTVDGQWIDGSFATRSTLGNVTENLSVFIDGHGSQFAFRTKLEALLKFLSLTSWSIDWAIGDARFTWTCPEPADWMINTQQEFLVATLGNVQAQVARLPAVSIAQVV